MVSEDKVKIMTRLALYEQKEQKSIKSSKYYKNDYVGYNMINTALLITMCYIAMLVIIGICRMDYLMKHVTEIDIWGWGRKLIILYIAIVIVYMLLAYIVYSVKYRVMQESNRTYVEDLKKLCRIYKKEQREKREAKIGETEYDDETFDY